MSADIEREIGELCEQAGQLPLHSKEGVARLERAAALADSLRDTELGYSIRRRMLTPACNAGLPEKLLVAFSWCLAASDADPERHPDADVLWEYKWVLEEAPGFAEIRRERIASLLDDFQKRAENNGANHRAVEQFRCYSAMLLGDAEEARRAEKAWWRESRDWLADCQACEQDARVTYQLWRGDDARALKDAQLILAGRMSCSEIPQRTDARVLLPLLRCDRLDDARRSFIRGSQRNDCDARLVESTAFRIDFLAVTDNLARGVELLEAHVGRALRHARGIERMRFFAACAFLLERVRETGRGELRLQLPHAVPWRSEDGAYAVEELAARFRADAETLARAFDERNGNRAISDELRGREALHGLVQPLELTAA